MDHPQRLTPGFFQGYYKAFLYALTYGMCFKLGNEPFTDGGCKFNVIAAEEAFIRSPFKRTLWLGGEGVMSERTLRTFVLNGENWT